MNAMTRFSTNLLLFSVLVCGHAIANSGESLQRRRTAIGGRETTAPTLAETSDMGKGMKFEKFSKGKGKGNKIEKSEKSEKTEGKGVDMVPGKGAKQDKEMKSVKSRKSFKSEKNDRGKGLKQDKSEVIPSPSTPSPTSADSILSRSSPFAITYSAMNVNPSTENLEELEMVTQNYLEDFMMSFFDKTSLTDLDNFVTTMGDQEFLVGKPGMVEYKSKGLFNQDSIFIPVTRELDNLIQDAIAQDEYLDVLNALSKSNPLRGTTTIAWTEADITTEGESTSTSSEGSSFVRAGVAAAAAGVVVLAAGLAMLKRRRHSLDDDVDDIQSFSPRKSATEDLTIADHPFEDQSRHFAHWRTAKSLNNGLDGGEFQDEPLDS